VPRLSKSEKASRTWAGAGGARTKEGTDRRKHGRRRPSGEANRIQAGADRSERAAAAENGQPREEEEVGLASASLDQGDEGWPRASSEPARAVGTQETHRQTAGSKGDRARAQSGHREVGQEHCWGKQGKHVARGPSTGGQQWPRAVDGMGAGTVSVGPARPASSSFNEQLYAPWRRSGKGGAGGATGRGESRVGSR
jgi:hypothetical protein